MARYRRYYRRVVRAAKKKWAPNTVEVRLVNSVALNPDTYNCSLQTIVRNGDRITTAGAASSSSTQILKTSRFRFRGVISVTASSYATLIYFISYVPEGVASLYVSSNGVSVDNLGNSLFYAHPEWIMAWGRKDFSNSTQSNEISLTSKLKRNLNSGDQVVFGCMWVYTPVSSSTLTIPTVMGTISYMCCAN